MGREADDDSIPGAAYRHPDAETDQALDWYLRLQEEGGDPAVKAEFERWLAGGAHRRDIFSRLQRMHSMPSLGAATKRDAARLGMASATKSRRGNVPGLWQRSGRGRLLAAATIMLLLAGIHLLPGLLLRWQADYITAMGEMQRIRLPDNSEMILNTASAVALDFEEGRRRVKLLAGEAFFDVFHDPAHPFIVAGSYSEVEAKGTAFNVRLDGGRDVVLLESGRVDVRRALSSSDRAELKPAQTISVSANVLSAVAVADLKSLLAWREGLIVFRDQPFGAALAELRRYYSGTVIVASSRFSESLVSGNYNVSDSRTAIRTLAESVGAGVTYLPGGVILVR